jgi:hypothetical protein
MAARIAPLLLGLAALSVSTAAGANEISIELNRLEAQADSCRVTMVVANQRRQPLASLRADLVLFDTGGIMARRLAAELGPVAASKTIVRTFEVKAMACGAIGSILLNDLPACRLPGSEDAGACLAATSLSSRASPKFFK